MNKCIYYQALVPLATTHLFVAAFRFYEHLAFDRTLHAPTGRFEFFVPQHQEVYFLEVMAHLESLGLVQAPTKEENRL